MENIIYNEDNLKEEDINNIVKRAKLIIENSNEELLLAKSSNNYYLIGGHVDNNENDIECLNREILEEGGNPIDLNNIDYFFSIIYYCKDYPEKNINTKYVTNYYSINSNYIPNIENSNLTENKKNNDFTLEYINKDNIINVLNENLLNCTKTNVVRDTLSIIKKYLKK